MLSRLRLRPTTTPTTNDRDVHEEGRPAAALAGRVHADRAAVSLDDILGDPQAQTAAAALLQLAGLHLHELGEQLALVLLCIYTNKQYYKLHYVSNLR